jgi:hypothetical protein
LNAMLSIDWKYKGNAGNKYDQDNNPVAGV